MCKSFVHYLKTIYLLKMQKQIAKSLTDFEGYTPQNGSAI